MEPGRTNILFAAGGTGGHLFPALAVADELRKMRPDVKILFVGTAERIESRVVPSKGYPFRSIWISGFQRGFKLRNIMLPVKIVVSLVQSFSVIRQFRPDVVVGTGGYVAGPALFAASMLGIPTVVHESNSFPGITTRLLSRRATKVFITFDVTKKWLRRQDNVERAGNPTRTELDSISRAAGAEFFKVDPRRNTLLVIGGSLGAASINEAVEVIANDLVAGGIQIIWQTGERDYPRLMRSDNVPKDSVWMGAFIDRMEFAYAAADMVVSRAGAMTLAELTRLGKPAVLVPYPHAAENHQLINARVLVDAGAAELIADHELQTELKQKIVALISDKRTLESMHEKSRRLGTPDAAHEIAARILALATP